MIKEYLRFTVEKQSALMPIKDVELVTQISRVHDIPHDSGSVEGFINYRGVSIPVISLAKKMSINENPNYSIDSNLIIIQLKTRDYALLVDEVIEVLSLEESSIQKKDGSFIGKFVFGAYLDDKTESWILDIDSLLEEFHTRLMQSNE